MFPIYDYQGDLLGYVGSRSLTCSAEGCINQDAAIELPASGEPVVCGPCGTLLDEGGPVEFLPGPPPEESPEPEPEDPAPEDDPQE